MKIIISGVGEVGFHLSEVLTARGHELSLIELKPSRADLLEQQLDARIINGSGTSMKTIQDAGAGEADIFLALSEIDEVNLVSCSLAKAAGAKRVIARCHALLQQEQRAFSYAQHFGIDYFVSPERLVSARLAKAIRSPFTPVLDQFARGEIEVLQLSPSEKSPVFNKPLKDLKFPARMRIGLVQRGKELTVPNAHFVIEPDDQLILIGAPDALKEASTLILGKPNKRKFKIALYGADDVGIGLLEYFNPVDAEIKVIEPDADQCRRISETFPWVRVVQGHATHSQLLREENIMQADIFVAATRDDEDNVMSCLQAAKLGINPTLLTIHRPDYAGILGDIGEILGIDAILSPRIVTSEELSIYVTDEPYLRLWKKGDQAEVIQVPLKAEHSPIFGTKIRDLPWPDGTLILGIERAEKTIVPTAEDEILPSDSLLILTLTPAREQILQVFESAM